MTNTILVSRRQTVIVLRIAPVNALNVPSLKQKKKPQKDRWMVRPRQQLIRVMIFYCLFLLGLYVSAKNSSDVFFLYTLTIKEDLNSSTLQVTWKGSISMFVVFRGQSKHNPSRVPFSLDFLCQNWCLLWGCTSESWESWTSVRGFFWKVPLDQQERPPAKDHCSVEHGEAYLQEKKKNEKIK